MRLSAQVEVNELGNHFFVFVRPWHKSSHKSTKKVTRQSIYLLTKIMLSMGDEKEPQKAHFCDNIKYFSVSNYIHMYNNELSLFVRLK